MFFSILELSLSTCLTLSFEYSNGLNIWKLCVLPELQNNNQVSRKFKFFSVLNALDTITEAMEPTERDLT